MNPAISPALEMIDAAGRAHRKARTATSEPIRARLIYCWHLYAWGTRERRGLLPKYRAAVREAIADYRAYRPRIVGGTRPAWLYDPADFPGFTPAQVRAGFTVRATS